MAGGNQPVRQGLPPTFPLSLLAELTIAIFESKLSHMSES